MSRGVRRHPPRRNPDGELRVAVRKYSALHDGLAPARVDHVRVRLPRYLVHVGTERAVEYDKRVDDDGDGVANPHAELYRHPFADGTGSEIFHDDRGQRWLLGGHNKVTERGITDMKRHHRRHMLGFIPRVNPDLTTEQILARGVGTALVAVAASKGMDTLMDPLFATDRNRSLAKGATGVVVGLLLRKSYPFVAAGFIAAGAIEVIQLGYRSFGLDAYEAKARDRVAQFVAGLHAAPVAPPATHPAATSGLYDMSGQRLGDGRGQSVVDPAALRKAMAGVPRS